MNVATGGHAQPALQAGGEIGDNVAEHIVGDDDIELAGVAHYLHAERVHVHVFRLELRIFGAHVFKHTLPQASSMGHGVRLVAHEYSLAWAAVEFWMAFGVFKCVADYSFHAFAS